MSLYFQQLARLSGIGGGPAAGFPTADFEVVEREVESAVATQIMLPQRGMSEGLDGTRESVRVHPETVRPPRATETIGAGAQPIQEIAPQPSGIAAETGQPPTPKARIPELPRIAAYEIVPLPPARAGERRPPAPETVPIERPVEARQPAETAMPAEATPPAAPVIESVIQWIAEGYRTEEPPAPGARTEVDPRTPPAETVVIERTMDRKSKETARSPDATTHNMTRAHAATRVPGLHREARDSAMPSESTIEVSIGTIHVTVEAPQRPLPAPSPQPAVRPGLQNDILPQPPNLRRFGLLPE